MDVLRYYYQIRCGSEYGVIDLDRHEKKSSKTDRRAHKQMLWERCKKCGEWLCVCGANDYGVDPSLGIQHIHETASTTNVDLVVDVLADIARILDRMDKIDRRVLELEYTTPAWIDGARCCEACGTGYSYTDLFCPHCQLLVDRDAWPFCPTCHRAGLQEIWGRCPQCGSGEYATLGSRDQYIADQLYALHAQDFFAKHDREPWLPEQRLMRIGAHEIRYMIGLAHARFETLFNPLKSEYLQ
jgi:hypothetical protein